MPKCAICGCWFVGEGDYCPYHAWRVWAKKHIAEVKKKHAKVKPVCVIQ